MVLLMDIMVKFAEKSMVKLVASIIIIIIMVKPCIIMIKSVTVEICDQTQKNIKQ